MANHFEQLDQRLDEWDRRAGLAPLTPFESEHKINEYLSYRWDELQKMDAQGCAIMHFEVSSYLTSLQRVINRLEAKFNYFENPNDRREIRARLDRLRYLNFPLKSLLKSLEMLHSTKEKELYYERRLHSIGEGEQRPQG